MENSLRLFFVIATFIIWLIPMLIALSRLSKRTVDETAKAVWVLVIVLIPIIGPLVFLMMNGNKTEK
jgi:hypothetical protein